MMSYNDEPFFDGEELRVFQIAVRIAWVTLVFAALLLYAASGNALLAIAAVAVHITMMYCDDTLVKSIETRR